MSSAVSSRAPSPSPSLMSIIYPGLRPASGRDSLQTTPLNTPLLSGRTVYSPATFQPIPQSSSSQSISTSDTTATTSTLVTVTAKSTATQDPPDPAPSTEQAVSKTTTSANPTPVHNTHPDFSSHQRSRSNEIDYHTTASRPLSAFRTPSDSTTQRPSSVDTASLNTDRGPSGGIRIRLGSADSKWLQETTNIISDYFGSSERIEHYLTSDDPLLRVTDC